MCASTAAPPSSLFRRSSGYTAVLLRRRPLCVSASPFSTLFLRSNPSRFLRLSASVTDRHLELSWFPPRQAASDEEYNGWAFVEAPPPSRKKTGLPTIVVGGIGTCLAALFTAIAYFLLCRKGFKLQFRGPFRALHGVVSPIEAKPDKTETEESSVVSIEENVVVSEASPESVPQATGDSRTTEKLEHVKVSVPADSTQLETLLALKKLKIVEDDVRADELCTRREYSRWLVRLNSLLERNPNYRIVPAMSLSGSVIPAFDDVGVEDPDFESIQALAEVGIMPSRLSGTTSAANSSGGGGSFYFYPERFVSRQDLISWRAQLEYDASPAITEQMSRTKVDYMDVKEISSDASPELFTDMLAGEKSIIRKVFGQSRRLQPHKPATKAQAAVALTSGRMSEAVYNEILRLEAEYLARLAAMQEIMSELLDKGDIERFWEGKINEERNRGLEVEKMHSVALHDLEEGKIVQVNTYAEHLKEKAAMGCQKQLLQRLKEEVDEMSKRLASERATYVVEQCNLQKSLDELQTKQEGTLDAKSILEAEIEALRILRSWVEDEARKSQARAKVLEEVGRRWKWDSQA